MYDPKRGIFMARPDLIRRFSCFSVRLLSFIARGRRKIVAIVRNFARAVPPAGTIGKHKRKIPVSVAHLHAVTGGAGNTLPENRYSRTSTGREQTELYTVSERCGDPRQRHPVHQMAYRRLTYRAVRYTINQRTKFCYQFRQEE